MEQMSLDILAAVERALEPTPAPVAPRFHQLTYDLSKIKPSAFGPLLARGSGGEWHRVTEERAFNGRDSLRCTTACGKVLTWSAMTRDANAPGRRCYCG